MSAIIIPFPVRRTVRADSRNAERMALDRPLPRHFNRDMAVAMSISVVAAVAVAVLAKQLAGSIPIRLVASVAIITLGSAWAAIHTPNETPDGGLLDETYGRLF